MKKLIQKWILQLKRKRYHKQLRADGNYKTLENSIRETGALCSNCNAPLTGPFCHICGQKDDDLKRPIWTLLREILDDVVSTDSRLFKTLILLALVPGGLTRAFREGRRARFVPPLRLYIVMSILFFVILSVADILILDINVQPKEQAEIEEQEAQDQADAALEAATEGVGADMESQDAAAQPEAVADEDTTPAELTPEERKARALERLKKLSDKTERDALGRTTLSDEEIKARAAEVDDALRDLMGEEFDQMPDVTKDMLRENLAGGGVQMNFGGTDGGDDAGTEADQDCAIFDPGGPYRFCVAMFVPNSHAERQGLKQADIDRILNNPDTPVAVKRATTSLAEALRDPEKFNDLFNDWLPKALFVLMPFFAFLLRIFHWGKDRRYLQQFVFALHFHTFLFMLLLALMIIIPKVGGDLGLSIFWWGTSLYLIIALKIGQGQGWFKAFFKAGFIWVSYFMTMMIVMFFVVFVGLSDISLLQLIRGDTSDFETSAEMAPAQPTEQAPDTEGAPTPAPGPEGR